MASISGDYSTGLVSHWKLEETGTTDNRVDSAGSNDLTPVNTVPSGTGIQGNAASFNRANSEYLKITDAAQSGLDLTGDHTINMWIKRASTNWMGLYSHNYTDTSGGQLYYNTSNQLQAIYDNGIDLSVAQTLTVGTWYMISVTYNDTTKRLDIWVNGSSIGNATGSGSIANPTVDFLLGVSRWTGLQGYFDGLIDEVSVWSRVLSGTDLTAIYNSGSGIPYAAAASGPASLKTRDTIAKASVKTIDSIAIASVKTIDTIT